MNVRFRALLFMPSFYGLVLFSAAYFLYLINIFQYEEEVFEARLIFVSAIVFFASSLFFNFSRYSYMIRVEYAVKKQVFKHLDWTTFLWLLIFFTIGLVGSIKYILDFSGYFGGVWIFFFLLLNDSAQIRIAGEVQSSIGFQLTYFAWIAASLFFLEARLKNINWKFILLGVLAFILNLLFIDRTRPLTIILTTLLVLFFVFYDRFKTMFLWRMLIVTILLFLSVFVIIGEWSGKVATEGMYGKSNIPPVFLNAVLYASSPFGYFNKIVVEEKQIDYIPSRSLYPGQKIFSSLKLAEEPPSQVNEFYFIPQPVNVGTFLEPLYRDGGVTYCLLGIILHSFLFDFLGLYFLKYPSRFGLYGLSILCFINFFAFFSPKFNNLPMWIFLSLAIGSTFMASFKFRNFNILA